MKIKEFNDMKAYLVKPNRLFTSRPPNTIGGGAIEGEDLGSRTGFAGVKRFITGENKNKYYVRYRGEEFGKRKSGSGFNEGNKIFDTKTEAEAFYNERKNKMGELKSSGQKTKILNQTEQINNFVDNFFDNNIDKFSVKDYDKFEKALIKEFKKANIDSLGKKGRNIFRHGLPNIGARDSKLSFDKYNVGNFFSQGKDAEKAYKNYFKKLFFSGKIETDLNLKQGINDFLNYEILDKRKVTFNPPENIDEVLYLVADDQTGTGKFRSGIIRKYFPDTMDKYIKKKSRSSTLYNEKLALIESKFTPEELQKILGGETSIKRFMNKQSDLLRELFDVSTLQSGLNFNLDHAEGIAEIAKMKNKEDIARALNNLIGMTSARNYELGWRGYSTKRKGLINQINQGTDVEKNLKELNKITEEAYPELKGQQAYSLKNNQLTPNKDFTFKYKPENAFRQYFTELSTNPIGAQELVKQAQTNKKLAQTLIKDSSVYENIVGNLQKILLEKGDISQKELSSLLGNYKKEKQQTLQLFGKLFCGAKFSNGGRVNLAEGSPNICSTDEMLSNMKKDKAISQGADKAEAAKAKARLLQAGKSFGKILGTVVAPADIAIELAFAGPALLRGDLQGAINATTYGFLGGGTSGMEQIKEKFGTDSTEYALYGTEEAIKDKMTSINELDKIIERGQQLGITESKTGEQVSNLGGARQEFAKNEFVKDFILASDTDKKVTQNFEKFYPLTTDKLKNIKALQNIANFSDAEQSLAPELDSDTVEGTIKGAGGYFKKEMAPRFDLPQYQENINRLKELRIGDFNPKAALEIPDYEKKQVDQGIKNYISQYGAEAAREQFEPQGFDIQPYLKAVRESYGNRSLGIDPIFMKDGGRINFADGGRLSFAEGPEDPSKRKFLKKTAIGGGILGGITTGLINLMDLFKGGAKEGIVAAKAAESEAQKIFFDLVSAVRNKGVLKQLDEASETSRGVTAYEYKGVKVAEDELGISVEFTTDQGAPAVVEYKKPTYDVDPETGTSFKVAGEFEEGQQVGKYDYDGNVDLDFEGEIMDDIENVKKVIDD